MRVLWLALGFQMLWNIAHQRPQCRASNGSWHRAPEQQAPCTASTPTNTTSPPPTLATAHPFTTTDSGPEAQSALRTSYTSPIPRNYREYARSEYDRGINTFSPEGRLFQVEYSLEAIKLGSTAIGVATGEGVILGVEKRVTSTLLETSSVEKIVEIDRHIGCAMSGLQADARSMVEHARVESQNHAFNYAEPLRVESCTQAICDLALRFGEGAEGEESIMSRPFGVALLIAGYDEDGPSLYHAEPSGTFYRYDAKAIGSGSEGAQAELQNEFHKSLTLPEAEVLVLKTLKQVMEEKLDSKNVQLASVTKDKGFRIYTDQEMEEVVGRLPTN
ncbi:hypothetical protein OPT61_g286 [Boeremia exigua]|uniref:Uncharacterized protein n=1 Tax=Boeremia exigua TaxID=749465 RepID=A0ACC2IUN9_9PLEO|nr:hypothetical protein OPT61_g286 [Boeremia exigua]